MPVNSFENYPMSWKPNKNDLKKPYYLSIAAKLEEDILAGILTKNTKLPPQRELADFLDLNLSTVTRAYKICELKGLIYAVTGNGTFVSPGILARDTILDNNSQIIEMSLFSSIYETNYTVLKASQAIINSPHAVHLYKYGSPLGTKRHIDAAITWMKTFGVNAERKNTMLTMGAQNALSIILISLFNAGDKIAVENFTYSNFKGLANQLHIQLIAVDSDQYGMSPEALNNICKQTNIVGIYLMPTCSNPTSIFMPVSRRNELADLIKRYDLLLIEDDIFSFLSPEKTSLFASILPEQTIHICSIAKSLCAGLRVAFVVFPERHKDSLVTGIISINLNSNSLNAEIISELIESGEAIKIVQQKITLANKRNQIYKDYFNIEQSDDIVRFYHWLRLPVNMTSEDFELLALQRGVHVLGSHRFAIQNNDKSSYTRLSITSPVSDNDFIHALEIIRNIINEKQIEFYV